MSYNFPTSPYTTHQPVGYTTSSHSHHGHGGYTYGTPLRRTSSAGHVYAPSPAYGYTNIAPSPGVQYLTVPGTHHSSRSQSRHRHDSHGHHGHGHGHGHGYSTATSASYPVAYATTTAPVYHQSTRHRSHSRHAHPSHARSHSHSRSHSHYPDAHGYHDDYHRGRTASFGDRVRQFFGVDPSSSSYYNSHVGRSRHNSFSGHKHQPTRTGFFGSTTNAKFVDKHGREVDPRGRPIHRY